ncbi:uncharacterized protein LOC113004035 [Solenopsis invicta]|uniref:uncharacterized protein LOC113004035 n=1 Tax=Solenopsis invicta TaxID=13686 RepID=UPI00193C9AFC|nr:uncharacterized protein LOC113004035 [Solenopsis invicta]
MVYMKKKYFSLNRILLLAVGLWPYTKSKFVRLQLVLQYGILGSFIVFQLTTFATSKCDVPLVIEILSVTAFYFNFVLIYLSFSCNMNVVKHLLEHFQHTYDELRDEYEVAIIEKYWGFSKRFTKGLTLLVTFNVSCFLLIPFVPYMFVNALSANESRPHPSVHIITKYFIDQEKYFYLIILHADVAYCVGALAMLATGTTSLAFFQHASGMFKIAGYRMEKAITIGIRQMNGTRNATFIYKGIIVAIDMHRKAIKIVEIYAASFNVTFALLIFGGILYASLNLYRTFREMSSGDISEKLLQPITFICVYYTYIFFANFAAQQITDHNNSMFVTVYNVEWYLAPLHIQKLILFMLQRGTKTLNIKIGELFVGSLEGFSTLTSATMSYFTFIYYTNH